MKHRSFTPKWQAMVYLIWVKAFMECKKEHREVVLLHPIFPTQQELFR